MMNRVVMNEMELEQINGGINRKLFQRERVTFTCHRCGNEVNELRSTVDKDWAALHCKMSEVCCYDCTREILKENK